MKVAPGAGNRMRDFHVALTMHGQKGGDGTHPLVTCRPDGRPGAGAIGSVILLDDFGDVEMLEKHLRAWQKHSLEYILKSQDGAWMPGRS